MKTRNFIFILTIFMTMFLTVGCSSGGGSSDSSDSSSGVLTLSSSSAVPGEYVTLTNSSFKASVPVTVTWSDDQNYSIETSVYPIRDRELKVAVPVYISIQSGTVSEGNVSIAISGVQDTKLLTIRKPITITYTDDVKPGDLLIELFKQNRDNYSKTLADISLFGTDTTDAEDLLNLHITRLDEVISEFESSGTITMYDSNGISKTLSVQEMKEADSIIYTNALGLLSVSLEMELSASSVYGAEGLNNLLDKVTEDGNAALLAVKNLRDKIPQMMDNIDGGSTLLLGGVTLVTGVAVLVGSIPAGTALVIGGLTAATYAVITGVHSEGLAWMSSRINESTLTADAYEFGGELADKAGEAATSFGLSLFSAGTELVGGLTELAYTGWNMFTSKIDSVCTTDESQSISLQAFSSTLDDEAEFCSEVEVMIIYKDIFEFYIDIPGYTGPFYKAVVGFGLANVDDGPYIYPTVAAASSLTPQGLEDDYFALIFSENLTDQSYAVDDTWITDGGIADLFFSTHEILDEGSFVWPVGFGQTSGTLNLDYYGTAYGDRLKGSFAMNVEGTKYTCINSVCEDEEDFTTETISGTISGRFDGFLKNYEE